MTDLEKEVIEFCGRKIQLGYNTFNGAHCFTIYHPEDSKLADYFLKDDSSSIEKPNNGKYNRI